MRVRCFGRLRDVVGDTWEVDVPPHVADSEALRAWFGQEHPALLDAAVRMALDDRMLAGCEPLEAAREVAFLPPVSGG